MRLQTSCAALLVALAAFSAAGAASAQDVTVTGNIAFTNDYVFRGFSQTDESPAIQAGVDATVSNGVYIGAWISNVDFGDETDAEIDVYGGYRTELAGFAVDVGAVGYLYAGAPDQPEYDYVEFKAAASRAIGPVTAGAAVFYSPDFFGIDEDATYAEANLSFVPATNWTVSGAVGKQWLDITDDYTTWNAGVSLALTEHVVVDARYYDTDVDGPLSEDRLVGVFKVLF